LSATSAHDTEILLAAPSWVAKILEALRIEMWLGLIPVAAFVIPLRLIGITREDDRTLIEICIKPVG
jgi:hypothetical protein